MSQALVEQFLLEYCVVDPSAFTRTADFLRANVIWSGSVKGLHRIAVTSRELAAALREQPYGAERHKRDGHMGWKGVRLVDASPKPTKRKTPVVDPSPPVEADLKSERFYVRLTPEHRELVDAAAKHVGLGLSAWILITVLREARSIAMEINPPSTLSGEIVLAKKGVKVKRVPQEVLVKKRA